MKKIISLLLIELFIFSCTSALRVKQEYDKTVDFNQYKTFSIYPWNAENGAFVNRDDQAYLVSSVAWEMTSRGYKRVEYNGDLIVDMYVFFGKETTSTTYYNYYTTGFWSNYYYAPYGFAFGTSYNTLDIEKGTVMLNVFDHKAKKLVWHAEGKGTIEPDPQYREQTIPKAITKTFYKFPKEKEKEKEKGK